MYPEKEELERRQSDDPVWAGLSEMQQRRDKRRAARTAPKPTSELVRLARELGKDPDELARALPLDTLKRLRYPLIRERDEEGKTTFRHPSGIREGITPLARK